MDMVTLVLLMVIQRQQCVIQKQECLKFLWNYYAILTKNTIDYQDNYDGYEREPVVLPARFPNLLVNGTTGIAVGMATNIPPHQLGEVIDGVLALSHNPDITIEELMEFIPGPDFPTGRY